MIPKPIRNGVRERANDLCEICGRALRPRWDCHHRKLRSQGGKDELSNLLALDLDCHEKAHNERRAWGEPNGYIVPSWQEPSEVPVLLWGFQLVHLDDLGYYAPIEESA